MTSEEARSAFPVLERYAYLNAGTTGPLARATADAMAEQQQAELAGGRSGRTYWEHVRSRREGVRGAIADLLGVDALNVALTYSTTNACNIVVAGLELGAEDEVVTTDEEHFGMLGPLHTSGAGIRVARTRGLPAGRALEALLAEVGPRTRLLALSHVSWMTGNLLPVAELKRETGLPVLVDGAQSVGAIPVEAGPFDFYTVSGQKWLCGPDATGALYVADPERLRVASPTYLSQEAHEPDGRYTPKPGAARFDSGSIPAASLAGLETALAAAPDWRFERAREISERCRVLLADRYEVVTAPGQATLVSFTPRGDAAEAAGRLYERGVVLRDMPRTGWLRASCGYWTSEEELERLLEGLD